MIYLSLSLSIYLSLYISHLDVGGKFIIVEGSFTPNQGGGGENLYDVLEGELSAHDLAHLPSHLPVFAPHTASLHTPPARSYEVYSVLGHQSTCPHQRSTRRLWLYVSG